MNDRVISFANCPNFRELGGYQTIDGQTIRQSVIFRSSHLADLNETEVKNLGELGITTVIDLRGNSERTDYPNRLPEKIAYHECNIDVGSGRSFFNQLLAGTASQESAHTIMLNSYGFYITKKSSQLSHMLRLLAETTGGVLLHCMVGKDRTGIAVALLLLALNVPRSTIMEDYLLSNDCYPPDKIMILINRHLKAAGVHSISAKATNAMEAYCRADRDYLQAAFDAIDDRYSGTEHYLTKILGLTKVQLKNLSHRFLRA